MGSKGHGRTCTVLVTGFEPFQDRFPVNPSFEILRLLPDLLPASSHLAVDVRIIQLETPVRVVYEHARDLIPRLLETFGHEIDAVLHIGMASGRRFYTMERYAHRDGYEKNKDLEGKRVSSDDTQAVFADCPSLMTTSLNFERILRDWQDRVLVSQSDGMDISLEHLRPSDDAGRYLCDYIYFNSLAWYARRNNSMEGGSTTDRPVMFLHVPAESDERTLQRGRTVAISLIEAMATEIAAGAPDR